jgi:hypothetical protein
MTTTEPSILDQITRTEPQPVQGPSKQAALTASEHELVSQYHAACEEVSDFEQTLDACLANLKRAKTNKARLYKVASVIDPSLKNTRPKS